MFEQMMQELNRGKNFYPLKGEISLYEKEGFFYFGNKKGYSLPFSGPISFNNRLYELSKIEMKEDEAILFQSYLNDNYEKILLEKMLYTIERISPYMNKIFFSSAKDFYEKTKKLLEKEYSQETLLEMLNLIENIDNYQDRFSHLFDLLSPESTVPVCSFLEPLVIVMKKRMKENDLDIEEFFMLFWEFKGDIKEKGSFELNFEKEGKDYSYNIKTNKEFLEIYLTL